MTAEQWENAVLLRVAAVNFDTTIFDTPKLSVIRGGSLLAQRLVTRCAAEVGQETGWAITAISTGSSTGIYRVEAGSLDATEVEATVRRWLARDPRGRHLTFTVGAARLAADGSDFRPALERLVARARWEQLQSCRLPSPALEGKQACAYDKLRAATVEEFTAEGRVLLSASTAARLCAGREERQAFYRTETGLADLPEFCDHLEEMTRDPSRDNLNGKMAVLYADGNQLGKVEGGLDRPGKLGEFDRALADLRRRFLTRLCAEIRDDRSGRWTTPDGKARLEVLFWGGDDFYLMAPAWCGWELTSTFYRVVEETAFGQSLSFAAGLVFCHHQAPIQGILGLASRLAGLAKQAGAGNHFAYQVLESFDFMEKDVESALLRHLQARGHPEQAVVRGPDMDAIATRAARLRGCDFPRSQLHRIVEAVVSGPRDPRAQDLRKRGEAMITSRCGDVPSQFTSPAGGQMLGNFEAGTGWVHLASLWDYFPGQDGGAA